MKRLRTVLMVSSVMLGVIPLAVVQLAFAQDEAGETSEASGESTSNASTSESKGIKGTSQKVATDLGVRGSVVSGAQYGPAGCGLGSLIFDPDSGFTQIFAATTNGTFGTQTFGITSGTSNCDDTDGGEESAKAFVETNRGSLAKEIARGQGESIAALSKLAGCSDSTRVGQVLQQNFSVIFPSPAVSDRAVSQSVVDLLKTQPSLGCGTLG